MTKVLLTCSKCGIQFHRPLKVHNRNIKLGYTVIRCKTTCRPPDKPCENCGTPTANARFCDNRCKMLVISQSIPKLQPQGKCVGCDKPIITRRKWCDQCLPLKRGNKVDYSLVLMGEARAKRKTNRSDSIWSSARLVYRRSGKLWICLACGYSLHVDICHVIPVASFPDETPLSVVNDITNLVALCPTHHWELDHGHLDMVDLGGVEPPNGLL